MKNKIILFIIISIFTVTYFNVDNVVVNTNSNLMWQDSQDNIRENLVYDDARRYCESLKYASHDDWRLPTIDELQSLIIIDKVQPLNIRVGRYAPISEAFENNQDIYNVVSSSIKNGNIYFIDFYSGTTKSFFDKKEKYNVRCVRKKNTPL